MPYKLFIPGPVAVSERTYQAMTKPLVGHRSSDFSATYEAIQPGLKAIFQSEDPVFVVTSSAWGMMEGALRNMCAQKVLCCMSGAFSDKWHDVALRMGLAAEPLVHEWGSPLDPDRVKAVLDRGGFDAITMIHNETSTGTRNPIEEVLRVVQDFPEVISIVDTVSSFAGCPTPKDAWGADIMITGSQKALALPPGLSIASVSERALKRAESIPNRGYYFDFLEILDNHKRGTTVSTPAIPLFYALQDKLEEIDQEGLEARYARHERLNQRMHKWVDDQGLALFPQREYASKTLSCIKNTREIDVPALNQALKDEFGFCIDGGYGKLKGKTFRISNMGNETDASFEPLLNALDALINRFAKK